MRKKCQIASTPKGCKRQVWNQLVTTEQNEPKRHHMGSTASTPCPQCCTPVIVVRRVSGLTTADLRMWVNEIWENEWLWLGKINLFIIKSHFPSTRSHTGFCCSNFQQTSSTKSTAFYSRFKCKHPKWAAYSNKENLSSQFKNRHFWLYRRNTNHCGHANTKNSDIKIV